MIKAMGELSVVELQKMLDGKRTQLEGLVRKRNRLQKQLADVQGKIDSLEGKGVARERKPVKRGTRRPQNDRTLKDVVEELLTEHPKGLTLGDLAKKVLETGYKTSSGNFNNTLYQCLYNHERINLDKQTRLYLLS